MIVFVQPLSAQTPPMPFIQLVPLVLSDFEIKSWHHPILVKFDLHWHKAKIIEIVIINIYIYILFCSLHVNIFDLASAKSHSNFYICYMILGHKLKCSRFLNIGRFLSIWFKFGKKQSQYHNVLTAIHKFLLYHHVPSVIVYRTNWIHTMDNF